MQLSKFSSPIIDVITIYRSKQGQHETLKTKLMHLLNGDKTTLVVGDFNFCFKEESTPIKSFLAAGNFKQLVNEPTHIDGHILDQAYLKDEKRRLEYSIQVDSKYYSDHRGISVLVKVVFIKKNTNKYIHN